MAVWIAALSLVAPLAAGPAWAEAPVRLRIIGSLAGVGLYTRFEEPFWRRGITERTAGAVEATIRASDASGIRGTDLPKLIRLGVVPFGTASLSSLAADDPELAALDLPGLNPDMAALRRSAARFRPHLEAVLRGRGLEALAVYTYAAQVLFCASPFAGLADLAGRRVRVSSVDQSEMMAGLQAIPVVTAFSEVARSMRDGVVDCAVTGALAGLEIGLPKVASHVHAMALTWGVSVFAANTAAWFALPPSLRAAIQAGLTELEHDAWDAAERDTARGLACAEDARECPAQHAGGLAVVPISRNDAARARALLADVVLPRWAARCGAGCVATWNDTLAGSTNLRVRPE